MSNLTEVEIFDCMSENLQLAAQHCDELAVTSLRGEVYSKLRDELELIEGCCQQASAHREDTRWLPIGMMMGECHKRAGDWLRGYKIDGEWVKPGLGELNLNFVELAKHLRSIQKLSDDMRTKATGKVGMILPETPREFMRENRKHRVVLPGLGAMSPGGIIIPHGAAA